MVHIDKRYTSGTHSKARTERSACLTCSMAGDSMVMHHFMWLFDIDADGTEHPRDYGCSNCSSAEAWDEPKGRTTPIGLHIDCPNMRLPDEYDEAQRTTVAWV